MDYPIRVLHVLAALNRGGAETIIMNLYRHIDKSKIQFDFAISEEGNSGFQSEIEELGGRIFYYPKFTGNNYFKYTKWWNTFFKNNRDISIVHAHMGRTAPIYLRIAKKYGLKTVAHSHNSYEKVLFSSVIRFSHKELMKRCTDYYIGCSEAAAVSRYGKEIIEKPNFSVLKNGIDLDQYAFSEEKRKTVRESLGLDQDAYVIGTVGRLTKAKNPDGIIEILFSLKQAGIQFIFLWVGFGELEDYIKAKIHSLSLDENVMMLGLRSDVPELMQAMDVFLFPSLWEGLPISAIEAQASGLPTLCSSNISEEVRVSNLCQIMSLAGYDKWVQVLADGSTYERYSPMNMITEAGYDICSSTQEIEEVYSNLVLR